MKIDIVLIRHGLTEGNLKKRYIGRTDEPLCEEGRQKISRDIKKYPKVEKTFVSPMKRCLETAQLIYPDQEFQVLTDFRECDFGIFEGKNYLELSDCSQYQQWVDSGGTLPFPEGESRESFQERSLLCFEEMLKQCLELHVTRVAVIAHGGTIMSIMERYGYPGGNYYDYQIENGEGYELVVEVSSASDGRIYIGSDFRGSQMDVSSGAAYWGLDFPDRKNYQRLFAKE